MPPNVNHLSYSSITTYLLCARSWRYRYLDRAETRQSANLAFGSAFHSVIEQAILARGNGDTNLGERWLTTWAPFADATPDEMDWGDSTFEGLRDAGMRMLATVDTAKLIPSLEPFADQSGPWIEHYVELHVPGVPVPIVGYIDLVDSSGIPLDFKTSARAWDQKKAQEESQPIFYLAALNQAGFPLNKSLQFRHVVFVKPSKTKPSGQVQTITSTRSIGDLFRLFGTIQDVWKAIEAGAFQCNTGTWKCSKKYCDYFEMCQGRN